MSNGAEGSRPDGGTSPSSYSAIGWYLQLWEFTVFNSGGTDDVDSDVEAPSISKEKGIEAEASI